MKQRAMAIKMLARNGWRKSDGVRLLLAVGAALLATWSAWHDMAISAIQNDYARPIVLVIPIMAWLVWVRRARFRFVRPGGYAVGWVVLFAGAQLFYMAHYVFHLRSAWHLGAVLMVAGAIIASTGKSVVKQFMPAWLVMLLLVPVPYTLAALIATPIQLIEAYAIAELYGVFGVHVEVLDAAPGTAHRLVVGGTMLPLASACKGLPTVLSLMLISYGFVFGSPMRYSVRTTLLLISPVVAILCSALALGGTLWLYDGHSAPMTADLIRALSEWATLLFAFLLIAGALRVLAWASVPVHQYHLASASP
ncbi:MAG: exosortase/archaeosortase family protein [Phycisphaeraceae bacterium]